jgi:hypothetical protein
MAPTLDAQQKQMVGGVIGSAQIHFSAATKLYTTEPNPNAWNFSGSTFESSEFPRGRPTDHR